MKAVIMIFATVLGFSAHAGLADCRGNFLISSNGSSDESLVDLLNGGQNGAIFSYEAKKNGIFTVRANGRETAEYTTSIMEIAAALDGVIVDCDGVLGL